MNAVQRFCDRAMLLDRGDMIAMGDPREVARRYEEINMARYGRSDGPAASHAGDGTAAILDCWIEDDDGRALGAAPARPAPCGCGWRSSCAPTPTNPRFGFMVTDEQGRGVLAIASESTATPPGGYSRG